MSVRRPAEMRDQLYQQVAQKALGLGDLARARQILREIHQQSFAAAAGVVAVGATGDLLRRRERED